MKHGRYLLDIVFGRNVAVREHIDVHAGDVLCGALGILKAWPYNMNLI